MSVSQKYPFEKQDHLSLPNIFMFAVHWIVEDKKNLQLLGQQCFFERLVKIGVKGCAQMKFKKNIQIEIGAFGQKSSS